MPMQAISAGLLAGVVGFASSFAVVLQGFVAMGASPSQAASGLMAVSIAMGLCGDNIWCQPAKIPCQPIGKRCRFW